EEEQQIYDRKKAALEDLRTATALINNDIVQSFQEASESSIEAVKEIVKEIDELERRLTRLKRKGSDVSTESGSETIVPPNAFSGLPTPSSPGSSSTVQTNSFNIYQQPGQSAQDVVRELVREMQNLSNNAR